MPASFMKKTMAYLGLVDDDYDDYDDYDARQPSSVGRVGPRSLSPSTTSTSRWRRPPIPASEP